MGSKNRIFRLLCLTAEAPSTQSKECVKKYSGFCELSVSVVNRNSDISPRRRGGRGVEKFLSKHSELG
jgi:hypothetical protein